MDATQKQEPTETLHKSSNQQKHYTKAVTNKNTTQK